MTYSIPTEGQITAARIQRQETAYWVDDSDHPLADLYRQFSIDNLRLEVQPIKWDPDSEPGIYRPATLDDYDHLELIYTTEIGLMATLERSIVEGEPDFVEHVKAEIAKGFQQPAMHIGDE